MFWGLQVVGLVYCVLLVLLVPAVPMNTRALSNNRMRIDGRSVLVDSGKRIVVKVSVALPTTVRLSSGYITALAPILGARSGDCGEVLPTV